MNPRCEVPTMEIDGLVLTDSVSGLIQQCISKLMTGKELTSATS